MRPSVRWRCGPASTCTEMRSAPRGRERRHEGIDRRDHQMHVEELGRMRAQRLHHVGAERDVRDEMPVHDVEMDPVRARGIDRGDLRAEAREIGREDGRGDQKRSCHGRRLAPGRGGGNRRAGGGHALTSAVMAATAAIPAAPGSLGLRLGHPPLRVRLLTGGCQAPTSIVMAATAAIHAAGDAARTPLGHPPARVRLPLGVLSGADLCRHGREGGHPRAAGSSGLSLGHRLRGCDSRWVGCQAPTCVVMAATAAIHRHRENQADRGG